MGRSPKEGVRPFHALETLATTTQSSRRTEPSSPPSELLLARVDTGRGAVRSALRRSGLDRGTALPRVTRHQHSAPARLVVIIVAYYLG